MTETESRSSIDEIELGDYSSFKLYPMTESVHAFRSNGLVRSVLLFP